MQQIPCDPFEDYIQSDSLDLSVLGQWQAAPTHDLPDISADQQRILIPVLTLMAALPSARVVPVSTRPIITLYDHIAAAWLRLRALMSG